MPPKPMFTRKEIVQAALDIVSERGIEALTARELGVKLGSSARPLFTVFKNMEELHEAVRAAAMARFEACAPDGIENAPIFKKTTNSFNISSQYVFLFLFTAHLYMKKLYHCKTKNGCLI